MTTIPATVQGSFYEKLYPDTYDRFRRDVADHQLTVVHDQGLYRHLRFRNPKSFMYWYDLVTFPGSLVIKGDMGTHIFTREEDMFGFFGTGDINPSYWAEKTPDWGRGPGIKEYRPTIFESTILSMSGDFVREHTVLDTALFVSQINHGILEEKDDYHAAVRAASDFSWNGHEVFPEIHGMDFTEYTEQFLWSCLAIPYGIRHYRATKTR